MSRGTRVAHASGVRSFSHTRTRVTPPCRASYSIVKEFACDAYRVTAETMKAATRFQSSGRRAGRAEQYPNILRHESQVKSGGKAATAAAAVVYAGENPPPGPTFECAPSRFDHVWPS